MPMPKFPKPEWTDEEVDVIRRRGKQLALDRFQADPRAALEFTLEHAKDLLEVEKFADGRSAKWQGAMVYELHDAATRFYEELRSL